MIRYLPNIMSSASYDDLLSFQGFEETEGIEKH